MEWTFFLDAHKAIGDFECIKVNNSTSVTFRLVFGSMATGAVLYAD